LAAKGYTSTDLVAAELGRTLTAAQLLQCATLIPQAESFIDTQTGKAWMTPSPIVDELHQIGDSSVVYLGSRPVTAVTIVKVRALSFGSTDVTLVAGTDYELFEASRGVLLLNGSYQTGSLLKVSYTSTGAVPGDIQRAATLLVAGWLTDSSVDPDLYQRGIESYSVGSDLSVKFRTQAGGAPDEVLAILRAHEAIVFA
jgi:hypothetical protein